MMVPEPPRPSAPHTPAGAAAWTWKEPDWRPTQVGGGWLPSEEGASGNRQVRSGGVRIGRDPGVDSNSSPTPTLLCLNL